MYYTFEYGSASSRFPKKIMEKHNFRNVDDSVASYVNNVKNYLSQGRYNEAATYIYSIKEVDLSKYILTHSYLNFLDEETRNLEIYIKSQKQQIFYQASVPELAIENDVWLV